MNDRNGKFPRAASRLLSRTLGLVAIVTAGCASPPPSAPPGISVASGSAAAASVPACPSGTVPMDPASTYAVYTAADNKVQVELTNGLTDRCIIAVSMPPPSPASSPSTKTPRCPSGYALLRAGTYVAEYFQGDTSLQIEDARRVRGCIKSGPEPTSFSTCPSGYREKTLSTGVKVCVPR